MSKRAKSTSRCCVWDFTMFYPKTWVFMPEEPAYHEGIEKMHTCLGDFSKKYAFQLERGEKTGRYHLQGRFSLKHKVSKADLVQLLNKVGWTDYHVSCTSSENRTNDFYVTKEETRIDGPFTDENYVKVPIDIKAIQALRPWQESLKNKLEVYESRKIDVIVETKGNIGKTTFCRYMAIRAGAQILPFCNEYRDIMRMAYDVGVHPIYMIDIPRSIPQKKLAQLYAALESLKGGYAYDDRNSFRQRYFDPPRVVVFTNTHPNLGHLSADRWNIWEIDDLMRLRKFNQRENFPDFNSSSDSDSNGVDFDTSSDDF